jgi:DNA polymerase III sliding clamp (beta) subunit (PCNA family)
MTMELKISSKSLRSAMNIVKRALPKLVLQKERGHVLFKIKDNILTASATNNDARAYVKVDIASTGQDVAFTADPKVLDKILSKISIPDITLDYNLEDLTLKIYTNENKKSFTTIQSFPPEKMLTYTDRSIKDGKPYVIKREELHKALLFSLRYLSPPKEDKKQYDFTVINKGIVYAANGLNKMGFYVSTLFSGLENIRIRKVSVPLFVGILNEIDSDTVTLMDYDSELSIQAEDGRWSFSVLKSSIEASKIMTDFIKTDDPYTKIDKNNLMSAIDRVAVSSSAITGAAMEMILTGKDTESILSLNLISDLKSVEEVSCEKVKDTSEEPISHVIEYKLFKSILDSVEGSDLKLFINVDSKFFRIISVGESCGAKYLIAGIGSYSKLIRS